MKLIDHITQAPRAIDPALGQTVVDRWGASGPLADVLRGASGTSPYLNTLLRQQADWLQMAVTQDAPLFQLYDALRTTTDPGPDLRIAKQRVAGYLALAELSAAHDVMDGTERLTRFADLAVDIAMRSEITKLQDQGRLPRDLSWFVIAMGKMGADELNYSSDIDIIVYLDDSRLDPPDAFEFRSQMVKATRRAYKTLSEHRADGYVFRTDLRLRPDPSTTPVCVLTGQALQYYESLGRTWERAAYIKARPCAGDIGAGTRFLEHLRPFVWRKYLDFAAIEEAHGLRLKIWQKEHVTKAIQLPGHDVKLGRGGLRDIEFYTQTRQLISGGRDPDLRDRGTLPALAALAHAGWVEDDVAQVFQTNYKALRRVEHAIQMMRDAQTQSLPNDRDGLNAIAAMLGQDLAGFEMSLQRRLTQTHQVANAFFDPEKGQDAAPDLDHALMDQWLHYPALRTDRGAALFEHIKPRLLAGLYQAADPQQALIQFDQFLKTLPAGIQVFSLFAANEKLVDLFTSIIATSPALAHYLGRNARVLDSVVSGQFFAPWPGIAGLTGALSDAADTVGDYEGKLDSLRSLRNEWHFRIGVHLIKGLIPPATAVAQYSDLAQAVLQAITPIVDAEFQRKFGTLPGGDWMVLGMGSLGARTLTAQSDLDVLVIFDADPDLTSTGPRSLPARQYYARLTQALITALTAKMPNGTLYEVDMRLRPSGKAGPIATRLQAFEAYQMNDAWTWEHLALTRARPVAGSPELMQQVEDARRSVLIAKSGGTSIVEDVQDMRARLRREKRQSGPWDMKNGPGGLMDIELLAQTFALKGQSFERGVATQLSPADPAVRDAFDRLLALKVVHSVLAPDAATPLPETGEPWACVARHCRIENLPQLEDQMSSTRRSVGSMIDTAFKDLGKG